jgi:ParB-like chromosome segregation protein Spo0J
MSSSASKKPKADNLAACQSFEIVRVNRRDIKKAPYNPRVMAPEHAKLLKTSLKKNGLVEPLVWNKRTGNLVGGHQRIGQIDELEQRDDYDLDVSAIDVDEREERNVNLALNNKNLQGDWDMDALVVLLADCEQPDFAAIGMTEMDIAVLCGSGEDPMAALQVDSPERAETKDKLADIKQDRKAMNERLAEEQRADYYSIVVFETGSQREAFYALLGFNPSEMYLNGQQMIERVEASRRVV